MGNHPHGRESQQGVHRITGRLLHSHQEEAPVLHPEHHPPHSPPRATDHPGVRSSGRLWGEDVLRHDGLLVFRGFSHHRQHHTSGQLRDYPPPQYISSAADDDGCSSFISHGLADPIAPKR